MLRVSLILRNNFCCFVFFTSFFFLRVKYNISQEEKSTNPPSHPDFSGQTALHFTASKNNLETARKLISHKASARVKDKRGQLPLHRAAAIGSVPMASLLLENKSPLNATDVSGLTALHHGTSFVILISACIGLVIVVVGKRGLRMEQLYRKAMAIRLWSY